MQDLEKIKVSVITPVFNDESYIERTLNSIINQTHKNLEIILINDCSTDNSLNLIKKFSDKRIKLINNSKNMGAAYSRNVGISVATGEYIAFLDGDDFWNEDKIEKQLFFMISKNYNFSYCNYYVFDNINNKIIRKVTGPIKINHKQFLKSDYVGCLTVMFKKEVFPTLCIPDDIKKRNDYALWLLLSQKSDCYLFDEYLAYYVTNNSGISSTRKAKLIRYHYRLYKKLLNFGFLKSSYYTFLNIVYFVIRKLKYQKKFKEIDMFN